MSSDIAMKTLGLKVGAHGEGMKKGKAKTLNDYSEDDILHAFQSESATLGLYGLNLCIIIYLSRTTAQCS